MPTVTVREYTVDRGHYDVGPSNFYPHISRGGGNISSGRGILWAGDTDNAIGTYESPSSIHAEKNLVFSGGTKLRQGTITGDYQDYSFAYTIGGVDAGNITAVEIVGHKTSNGTVGTLSFQHCPETNDVCRFLFVTQLLKRHWYRSDLYSMLQHQPCCVERKSLQSFYPPVLWPQYEKIMSQLFH
jgi:hypothetical protein